MYVTRNGIIVRSVDGACVPVDAENADYRDFLVWVSDGGVVEEETASTEEAISAIEAKYEAKFAALRVRITNVLLADGLAEDTKRVALAAEWQAEQDAHDLEILELLGGV